VLQRLLEQENNASFTAQIEEIREQCDLADTSDDHQSHATVVYEFTGSSAHLEPRLRLSIKHPTDSVVTAQDIILQTLQLHSNALENNLSDPSTKYV
jgi:hypothetical protein